MSKTMSTQLSKQISLSNRSSLGAMVNRVMCEMNVAGAYHSNESDSHESTPIPNSPEAIEIQQLTPLNSNRESHAIETEDEQMDAVEIEPNDRMSATNQTSNDINAYHINAYNVSTLGANPGNLSARSHEKELIEDILTRCKIALTFLFNDESPLHSQFRVKTNFADRLIPFNVDKHANIKSFKTAINALYNPKYKIKHNKIFNGIWKEWNEFTYKRENSEYINITKQNESADAFLMQQDPFLQDIIEDFIQTKYVLRKNGTSLLGALGRGLTKRTSKPDLKLTKSEEKRATTSVKDMGKKDLDLIAPEEYLKDINNRRQMREWIDKYKLNDNILTMTFNCCSKNKYSAENATQRELDLSIPMDLWTSEMVVAFIEDNEELKHIASVFWEFNINGKELCKLNHINIELLIECSMLNNNSFDEIDLDELKLMTDKNEWELTNEAKQFVYYRNKLRVLSYVVSRYHLTIDIIHKIIDNSQEVIYKEFFVDARYILDVIEFLRAKPINGPKQYWKMDAYFFNVIDNYMSVLICDNIVRNTFQKCYSDFLTEPDKPPPDLAQQIIQENIKKNKKLSRKKSLNLMSIQNNNNNGNAIKNITTRLNLISSRIGDKNPMGGSSVALMKQNIEQRLETSCLGFMKNQNTIYLSLLCIVVFFLLAGSIFIILWWYGHGCDQIDSAMHLTIDALGERTRNEMIGEFWTAQMLMAITVGGLYNGDLVKNASLYEGEYNGYFAQFNNIEHTEAIFSLYLYNDDDNSLIGAYRTESDVNTIMIGEYNGTCRFDYQYGTNSKDINCNYDPTTTEWYNIGIMNPEKAKWSDPYILDGSNSKYYGMSLVSGIEFDETFLIIFCEIIIDSVGINAIPNDTPLPIGSIIMVATHGLDIFASSNDDIHLTGGCTDCTSSDSLVVSASDYLNTHEISGQVHMTLEPMDLGYISIFSFEMIYLNFIPDVNDNDTILIKPLLFDDPNDYQYGYIVIANDDTYLNHMEITFYMSFVLTGLILLIIVSLICHNMNIHHKLEAVNMMETVSRRFKSVEAYLKMTSKLISLNDVASNKSNKSNRTNKRMPEVGNRVTTNNGKIGTVEHIANLEEDTSLKLVAVKLHNNNQTIFTSVSNVTVVNNQLDNMEEPYEYLSDNEPFDDMKYTNDMYADDDKKHDDKEVKEHAKEEKVKKVITDMEDYIDAKKSETTKAKPSLFHCTQKNLLIVSFCVIFSAFMLLIFIWYLALNASKNELIYDIFAKQEFGSARDIVNKIYSKTEMVKDIIIARNDRGDMDLNNDESRNRFLSNLMQAFVDPHPIYGLYYIYFGLPDGNFIGVRWSVDEYTYKLKLGIRDASTNWQMTTMEFSDNVTVINEPQEFGVWDARCRPWYQRGVKYTFKGTVENAFPNGEWNEFITDDRIAANAPACEEARLYFANMFNVSLDSTTQKITSNKSDYINNIYEYNGENGSKYNVAWSKYIFSTLQQVGLTASTAIQDEETGDLLGILGVDFTLEQLSLYLYDSVRQHKESVVSDTHFNASSNEDNTERLSWIFNADNTDPDIVASSEFTVLQDTSSTEGCFGLQDETASDTVPIKSDQHPNYYIRTLSKEILNVTGIDNIPINNKLSYSMVTPIKFPIVEVSRISFPPINGEASIDWIVVKTTTDETEDTADNVQITFYLSMILLASILVIMKEIDYIQNVDEMDDCFIEDCDRKDPNYYYFLMEKMKPIILGSSNVDWNRIILDNDLDELNTDNIFNLDNILEDKEFDVDIITTKHAKKYMANKANELISNENDFINRLIEFAMKASNCREFRISFFLFIESSLYSIPNQLILYIHLLVSLLEPATPKELKMNGLSNIVMYTTLLCIIFEWLDIFCMIYRRYVEFSIDGPYLTSLYELNYGIKHKYSQIIRKWTRSNSSKIKKRLYLIFFGPNSTVFLIHIFINTLILFDFISRVFFNVGYLSYSFPVLPILIIIRNETILEFAYEFVFALIFAKDVLFSYLCFMLIFSLLSMSLYRTVVNSNDFSGSFENVTQALITAFVYISTAENYTFMYDVFDSEYYINHSLLLLLNALFVSLSCTFIGLFIFIPMIIHRFELAFEESKILSNNDEISRKENAIVASFILLDFNGDLDIDENEFESLVSSSILVDKNKLFSVFDENESDGIDINEFVQTLLKQTFRTKIMSMKIPQQNKLRAWIECNILRHRLYQTYVLVVLVLPFAFISVVTGLSNSFSEHLLDYLLYIFFIANFIEIHLKMFIFGIRRHCDLLKYLNPTYVSAAIEKYQKNTTDKTAIFMNNDNNNTYINNDSRIKLNTQDRMWVFNYLNDVRPYSLLEKTTLSLINTIEITLIWVTLLLFIVSKLMFYYYESDKNKWMEMNERYCIYFIQFGVLTRIFLIIPSNQKLIYVIFTVFPQFMSLFAFLILFIYFWARIGCTLFGDNRTEIVIDEVYEQSSSIKTNFDSLWYSMLALLQLMVGEGWHEIMYYNVIATHPLMASYFITYIIAVTIIISNVFVGLFLADIDELSIKQSNDEIIQLASNKIESFEKYAKHQLSMLNYKIKKNDFNKEQMQKQVDHIEELLYKHKLKSKSIELFQ